jgi:hypothetical protein
VLGRPVKHTVLVYFNLLNDLFLGDLIEMFKSKGGQPIDAEEAFTNPVFSAKPKVVPARRGHRLVARERERNMKVRGGISWDYKL